MRTVTIKHRNGLGERTYRIYESVEQLMGYEPTAKLKTSLSEAEEGDYVVSLNGWVVPLIRITELVNKYYKAGYERRKRNKTYTHRIFHFPQQRICVPLKKLSEAEFNYKPRDSKNIAGSGVRNRMYEVTTRKIYWAQLVADGMNPERATALVYDRVINKNKLTKSLLLNDKLIKFIEEKSGERNKRQLKKFGVDDDFFVKKILSIMKDEKAHPTLRIFVIKFIYKILYGEEE